MLDALETMVRRHPRLVALTGAGVSAASGIPTYRDDDGRWKHNRPIQHQEFVADPAARQRYWARSMAGWHRVGRARPNRAHRALAALETMRFMEVLVTQNVDRLHQQAGHENVVDLHGRLDRVTCLQCGQRTQREALQARLRSMNPEFEATASTTRPDGDAELEPAAEAEFRVPDCEACGGTLMPDVVFFGGSVPRRRVSRINAALERADALVAAGSSLVVYSGFRICRLATELGKPLIIINRGQTRADELATLKIEAGCGGVLEELVQRLAGSPRAVAS